MTASVNRAHEQTPRPAVFLDRDGTINIEVEYLGNPDQLRLLDGAGEAIARLNRAGIPVIVVTNQAGVARGYFSESDVYAVHARLDEMLLPFSATIDRYIYCPHHPKVGNEVYCVICTCRKPLPGMLLTAAEQMQLDLPRSLMVGDKLSDLEAGAAAGCRTILVRTGYGADHERQLQPRAVHLLTAVDTLFDAVDRWLAEPTTVGP